MSARCHTAQMWPPTVSKCCVGIAALPRADDERDPGDNASRVVITDCGMDEEVRRAGASPIRASCSSPSPMLPLNSPTRAEQVGAARHERPHADRQPIDSPATARWRESIR